MNYIPKKITALTAKKLLSTLTILNAEQDLIYLQTLKVCLLDIIRHAKFEHGNMEAVERGFAIANNGDGSMDCGYWLHPTDPFLAVIAEYFYGMSL